MGAELTGVGSLEAAIERISSRWTGHYVFEVGSGKEYAVYMEYGTRSHPITPRDADVLHFWVDGKEVFADYVNHPGTEPNPFMQPAAEAAARSTRSMVASSDDLEELAERMASVVQGVARDLAPKDTGELAMSIRIRQVA